MRGLFALSLPPPPWASAYFGNTSLRRGITWCKALTNKKNKILFIWFPWYPMCTHLTLPKPYPSEISPGGGKKVKAFLKAKVWGGVISHLYNGFFFPHHSSLSKLSGGAFRMVWKVSLDWPTQLLVEEGRCFQVQKKNLGILLQTGMKWNMRKCDSISTSLPSSHWQSGPPSFL